MTRIKQVRQGLVTVLVVESPMVGDVTADLQEKIHSCLETGELHLILDFQRIPFLDSTALEVLLTCSRLARRKGGALKLAHVTGVCNDIFIATRLGQVLEIYQDIHSAQRSFL